MEHLKTYIEKKIKTCSSEDRLEFAEFLLKEGGVDDAIKVLDISIIQFNQTDYDSYFLRSQCYSKFGKYESALSDSDKLIELYPSSKTYFHRGNIHLSFKHYDSAIKDYTESIKMDKGSDAYFPRAKAYIGMGNTEGALESYLEAIEDKTNFRSDDEIYSATILASHLAIHVKKFHVVEELHDLVFKSRPDENEVYKYLFDKDLANAIELETKTKELKEKDKELEDMMSMFAHKFRSPLDAIIYNTSHENNPKLYIEAAQTMRGLLDIFSIISTDDKILTEKLKTDIQGNSNLIRLFSKILNMIMLHLLSVSGTDKIHQHYMSYAKAQGIIDASVSTKEWIEEHFELEQNLQNKWEQSFALLLSQSASLEQRLEWLEKHFFKLELRGFDDNAIDFKEYATTESFLTILINEILVNAFKYYSSENKQPVLLEWDSQDNYQVLICRNPSQRSERRNIKGSGKGHTFLNALARKTNSQFSKPKPLDDFVLEFAIPNELLISKTPQE